LNANPLKDVAHANDRAGVLLRGRWYSDEELQGMLAGLANSHTPTLLERLLPLVLVVVSAYILFKR
jgi:hypothetical protein